MAREVEQVPMNNDKKITEDMVRSWLGSDALPSEIHEILAELANGEYEAKQMKLDIISTVGDEQ
jgi:type III secretion system FlhB-like substrate exporter